MVLLEIFEEQIKQGRRRDDTAQRHALTCLQKIHDQLSQPDYRLRIKRQLPVLADLCAVSRFFNLDCLNQPVKGAYLWGGVGTGKTWLMNLFYDLLPFDEKKRFHFHLFMQAVHDELASMGKQKNPLKKIARKMARRYRVICLDEFIVTNITDAMLLNGLLQALFRYGVCLVATSNRVPDDLYLNGLQRERFLPAIALIKQNMHVIELDNGIDHRIDLLESQPLYFSPLNDSNRQAFADLFDTFCGKAVETQDNPVITLHGRPVQYVKRCNNTIWFNFTALCSAPRATPDYLEISRQYQMVFLGNVPALDESCEDMARRFIYLVDTLYDAGVKLIMLADAEPEQLYHGRLLSFAFRRTASRLIEMRSSVYLEANSLQSH